MAAGLIGAPAGERAPLADVRRWWRAARPPAPLSQRLYVVYCVAIFGLLAYGTITSTVTAVLTPSALEIWGPPLGLVALVLAARWGIVQGPVVFSVADVAQLLGAPLSRRGLVVRRLMRALALGGGVGALLGVCAIVGLSESGRGIGAIGAAGLVAGLALGGMLATVSAWAVQASARCERVVRRVTWPLLALAGALAWSGESGFAARDVALWSGPWGWVLAPGAGATGGAWPVVLGALALLASAAAILAARRCGHCPTARHFDRAHAHDGVVASLASFDARTARRALAGVSARPAGRRPGELRWLRDASGAAAARATRLRRVPDPAVVWRDAVTALRGRERLVQAALLAGAGTLLSVLDARRPLAVAAGTLVLYVAAASLFEPLRSEIDVPSRSRALLRARRGRVLVTHAVAPTVVVTLSGALAVAGCAIAGVPGERHGGAIALVAIAAAPAISLCAGLSARQGGQMPLKVLTAAVATDPTGGAGVILGWLLFWPLAAITLGAAPAIVAATNLRGVLAIALACCVGAACLLAFLLAREPRDG
jgi:hypothetical protein